MTKIIPFVICWPSALFLIMAAIAKGSPNLFFPAIGLILLPLVTTAK